MSTINTALLQESIHQLAIKNEDVEVVWIYGSIADCSDTENSDIDIAIAFQNFPKDSLTRLTRSDILASEWTLKLKQFNRKISIVDINMIPIPLAWEVINSDYVVYEKNSNRRFREENRIFSMMELDIVWHRKKYG